MTSKTTTTILFSVLSIFISFNANCHESQIDSIKIVSLDAGYTYIPFGDYNVDVIKDLLDEKILWKEYFDSNSDIEYKCILKNRRWINRFKHLLSKSYTSSFVDLSNFSRINVRIGLKIYKGNQIEYMFINPKSSDDFKKFIITETKELHASNALIRFLKKTKRKKRCVRY